MLMLSHYFMEVGMSFYTYPIGILCCTQFFTHLSPTIIPLGGEKKKVRAIVYIPSPINCNLSDKSLSQAQSVRCIYDRKSIIHGHYFLTYEPNLQEGVCRFIRVV